MLNADLLPYNEKRIGNYNRFRREYYRLLTGYSHLFISNSGDFPLKKVISNKLTSP